jgi:hypothetical protein
MREPLFMFLAHAVAAENRLYRAGARHALMLYATGGDIAQARAAAAAAAQGNGWNFVAFKREKEIDRDPSLIEDDVLRAAAEDAVRVGHSIVVYRDELALDS